MRTDMNGTCFIEEKEGLRLIKFKGLDDTGLVEHVFTTRHGGLGRPPCEGLNMGLNTCEDREVVLQNRKLLGQVLGFYPTESVVLRHDDAVVVLDEQNRDQVPEADAVITTLRRTPLTIFYADCVPVYIVDRKTPAIGLAHAGWRGTVKSIASRTVEKMQQAFGSRPQDCLAAVGPSICVKCFEVDDMVAAQFQETFPAWKDLIVKLSNKWNIDLWSLNVRQLKASGIPEDSIMLAGLCTACDSNRFFSYRRDNKNSGRMAGLIALK